MFGKSTMKEVGGLSSRLAEKLGSSIIYTVEFILKLDLFINFPGKAMKDIFLHICMERAT